MTIIEVLREANTPHEVFFLLTAYVEAVRYSDKFHMLPQPMRDLPLAGTDDLKQRVERINAGIDRTDILDRPVIREAGEIFTIALERLDELDALAPRALEAA
jgi:hypothetical protein